MDSVDEAYGWGVNLDGDSDSCGMASKHQTFSLELYADDRFCILYASIAGPPRLSLDSTLIRVPFFGMVEFPDHQGEIRWLEGRWLASIKGENLSTVFEHIRDGRRVSIKRNQSKPEKGKPLVSEIVVESLEE